MAESWTPYLLTLLGDDQHAQEQARQLLLLRDILTGNSLPAQSLIKVINQLAELDSARQNFLLPSLLELLASPSPLVRSRVLNVSQEWVGQSDELFQDAQTLVAFRSAPGQLQRVLDHLCRILLAQADRVDLKTPFSALSIIRLPSFALAMLFGLHLWARRQPNCSILTDSYLEFFTDEKRDPLRDLLHDWLHRGPLFLRYLLVRWMGETELSLSADASASAELMYCYRQDPDPLVASEAIVAYARLVKPDSLDSAVSLVVHEFKTFSLRQLQWAERSPVEALRELSLGLLRALGQLATDHYPAPEPLAAIRNLLTRPIDSLNLLRTRLTESERNKTFRAAVLLRGQELTVCVKPMKKGGPLYGTGGASEKLRLSDPKGLLARCPDAFYYEAVPQPPSDVDQRNDPALWTYEIVGTGRNEIAAHDLSPLFSPVLELFYSGQKISPTDLKAWEMIADEIQVRGAWMIQATDIIGQILQKARSRGDALDGPDLRTLFDYLSDMGAAANRANLTTPEAKQLRNLTRRIFLSQLAQNNIIRSLSQNGTDPLHDQFLVQLSMSALRSLPSEPSYRWVTEQASFLLDVSNRLTAHMKLKGPACVVVGIHTARMPLDQQEIARQIILPGRQVWQHWPDALRFANEGDLVQPEDLAKKDQKKDLHRMQLAGERLARALLTGLMDREKAEAWASTCLAGIHQGNLPLQCRLLQAYARCLSMEPGNIRRLLEHLLRTAPASALCFFIESLPNREQLDERFLRRIIRLAVEARSSSLKLSLDAQEIKDHLMRGPILMRLLGYQAQIGGSDFLEFYLKSLERPEGQGSHTALSAEGEVWCGNESENEVLTSLSLLGHPASDLASTHGGLIPTFVYCPQQSTKIRCIVSGTPIPVGTTDLHVSALAPENKRSRLASMIKKQDKFLLLARVLNSLADDRVRIDLGASVQELSETQIVTRLSPVSAGDPILVELQVERGVERVLMDADWEFLVAKPTDIPVYPLQGVANAIGNLEQHWRFDGSEFAIEARVLEVSNDRSPEMVECRLGTGFALWRYSTRRGAWETFLPRVVLSEADAPLKRDLVYLKPRSLNFRNRPIDADSCVVQVVPVKSPKLWSDCVMRGTLHSERSSASGRRIWTARIGDLSLEMPRESLTGDLQTLYSLDALTDDHPVLARLAKEPTSLRVLDRGPRGQRCSVIDAEPNWDVGDLIIGILSGEVLVVTFLRIYSDGAFLFEVQQKGIPDGNLGGMLTPLGVLARVVEGDLFDTTGQPVSRSELIGREGLRLRLMVAWGNLLPDGCYVEEQKGSPWLVVAEQDDANLKCRDAFPLHASLKIRIVSRSPLKMFLADSPRIDGMPLSDLNVWAEDRNRDYFKNSATDECEALIDRQWNPEAPDFQLTVRQPRENRLYLDERRLCQNIRHLLELEPGVSLRGRTRPAPVKSPALLIDGLWVNCDPLFLHMLPEELNAEQLARSIDNCEVLLTNVQNLDPRKIVLRDGISIPFLREGGRVRGLVTSKSRGNPDGSISDSSQIGVHWLTDSDEDSNQARVSDEWRLPLEAQDFKEIQLGHVLEARQVNEQIRLVHIKRYLRSFPLYEALPFRKWVNLFANFAAGAKQLPPRGTLLLRPANGRGWLFSMTPACLVEVPADKLVDAGRLDSALKLDIAEFALEWTEGDSPTLRVVETYPGAMRDWLGESLTLRVEQCHERSFECALRPPSGAQGWGDLRLVLSGQELAAIANPHDLAQRMKSRGESSIYLKCMLRSFDMEVTHIETKPGSMARFSFRLRPELVRFRAEKEVVPITQERTLVAAPFENGRLETEGKVVELGDRSIGVMLNHFRHDNPIPLSTEEQTWFRSTGQVVKSGWSGRLIILQTPEGFQASLRRLAPRMLAEWLKYRRLTRPDVAVKHILLQYFGTVTREQLDECGCEDVATEDFEWLLFEVNPGESFLARAEQLLFCGEPFDPRAPSRGDIINEFKLVSHLEGNKEVALNLLGILPDIGVAIHDFGKQKNGIFFGRVTLVNQQVVLEELRGAEYRSDAVKRSRLVRWRLVLEAPDAKQLAWLHEQERNGEDLTVYLKFVSKDEERCELTFRLLGLDEAFEFGNLIWVRVPSHARDDGVSPYGQSFKLMVRPFQSQGLFSEDDPTMYIPDSRFSTRRGRLREFRNSESGRIFLAKVEDTGLGSKSGDNPQSNNAPQSRDKWLGLVDNPRRPFGLLLNHGSCQVIVADVVLTGDNKGWLRVEFEEGVFIKLPLSRLNGLPTRRKWQRGDILFLKPGKTGTLVVTNVLFSNLDYLSLAQRPVVFVTLWGNPVWRRERWMNGKSLRCNLIGLPQLEGLCQIDEESIELDVPIPHVAVSYIGKEVRLEQGTGNSHLVGQLEFSDDHRVALRDQFDKVHLLHWKDVTFREGNPMALIEQLSAISWLNKLPVRPRDIHQESISRADLIVRKEFNRLSLTALADQPLPVDHLVEQFPTGGLGVRLRPKSRTYVVARSEPGQLILEIAPGRFCELPTSLLRQLWPGSLSADLSLNWNSLTAGDLIELDLLPRADRTIDEFLPYFQIRSLKSGNGRHLRVPFVTLLQKTPQNELVLGIPGPAAIPAHHLYQLVQDHPLDLYQFEEGFSRYEAVCRNFKRYGTALVIQGHIISSTPNADGWEVRFDIGIVVPIPGKRRGSPETIFPSDPWPLDTRVRLRILELEHDRCELKTFVYQVELDEDASAVLVRSENSSVVRCYGLPLIGDSVQVFRSENSRSDQCQVLGYDYFRVEWIAFENDPLHLEHFTRRKVALPLLLPDPTSTMWATVEEIDEFRRILRLSRRVQLQQVLPRDNQVGRAHVIGLLDEQFILVEVLGIPLLMPTEQLCFGAVGAAFRKSVAAFALALAGNSEGARPVELEVVCLNGGNISAVDVYAFPTGRDEVDSQIEQVEQDGILTIADGCRIFVSSRELAWCDLDSNLIVQLFKPEEKLRVKLPASRETGVFSHIRTQEIQREISWLRRAGTEPTYVALKCDLGNGRAIVRGESRVFLELEYELGTSVPERCPAYVVAIEEIRHVIQLSLERIAPRKWSLEKPAVGFELDRSTDEVLKARLSQLTSRLDHNLADVTEWAFEQSMLEATPRNLRCTLEALQVRFGQKEWWKSVVSTEEQKLDQPLSIANVWSDVKAGLAGTVSANSISGAASYAVGYWWLINRDAAKALPWLIEAFQDDNVQPHIDVWVTLASCLSESPESELHDQLPEQIRKKLRVTGRATMAEAAVRLLTISAARVWSGALRTIPLPLIEPEGLVAQSSVQSSWLSAILSGSLEKLKRFLMSVEEFSAWGRAIKLWIAVIERQPDTILDTLADEFLNELRNDEEDGQGIDSQMYVLAAHVSFARGNVTQGMYYLEQIKPFTENRAFDVPLFWKAWFHSEAMPSTIDPLLAVLKKVLLIPKGNPILEAGLIKEAWQSLRSSTHRWRCDAPSYRVVPRPPVSPADLRKWGEENAIPHQLIEALEEGQDQ